MNPEAEAVAEPHLGILGKTSRMSCREAKEMGDSLGLLKVKVVRGMDLAIRDLWSSDPYVVLRMGDQKVKTHVIKRNCNPEWNEELHLGVVDPALPIKLKVYDWDRFSLDDPMGNAKIDIQPFLEAVKLRLEGLPNGTIIRKLIPNRQNFLAEESPIYWSEGTVTQDMILRLRNVESGEVEVQLQWKAAS